MAGIRKREDVGESSLIGVSRWKLAAELELVGDRSQAVYKFCLVVLSENSPLQIERDFPAVDDSAEEELANLPSEIRGDIVNATETAKLDDVWKMLWADSRF